MTSNVSVPMGPLPAVSFVISWPPVFVQVESDQEAKLFESQASTIVTLIKGCKSVKFVKDSVARNIWMAIGTKANGEVVSADSY